MPTIETKELFVTVRQYAPSPSVPDPGGTWREEFGVSIDKCIIGNDVDVIKIAVCFSSVYCTKKKKLKTAQIRRFISRSRVILFAYGLNVLWYGTAKSLAQL